MSLDRRGRGTEKKCKDGARQQGGSWGQVRANKVEIKENRQMGWRVSTGPLAWDQRRALNAKSVVDNVGPLAVAIAEMP